MLPSAANFVFARHPQHDAAQLAAALRERAIIVRHFKHPRIDQFCASRLARNSRRMLLAALGRFWRCKGWRLAI